MEKNLKLKIERIQDLGFSFNEKVKIKNPEKEILFSLTPQFQIEPEKKYFSIVITPTFKFHSTKEAFLTGSVRTIYKLSNIEKYLDTTKTRIDLPDNVITTLLSLSVTHARAILAKNTSGTTFENILIPMINPSEMLEHIKSDMKETSKA